MDNTKVNSLNTDSPNNDNKVIRNAATYKEGKTKINNNLPQKRKKFKIWHRKSHRFK